MNHSALWICILAVMLAAGCGPSRAEVEAARMDRQVEVDWMEGHEVVNAIQFFEGGGHYEDLEPDQTSIDRNHVLPLAKRLQQELKMDPLVVLIDPETAFALVAELPPQEESRAKLRTILNEADEAFPGFVFDNWGQRWLSVDLLNETETKVLKDRGVLETLARRNR